MKFEIIVGSMLGASEYVADALAEYLQQHQHQVEIHLKPDLNLIDTQSFWIICSSTHGAGELPDNIKPFSKQIPQQDLSQVRFLTIALGDTSYDTFCHGGKYLHQCLQEAGATAVTDMYCIDVLEYPVPEDTAVEWLIQIEVS